jgi:hypothetical protein
MDFNFKFLGTFDVEKIKGKLHKLDWKAYTLRQDVHQVHKETFTVPLLFDPHLSKISLHKNFGFFIKDLEDLKIILTDKLGQGYLQSAILINLPAGKRVASHVDKAEAFKNYHRIHIPILTNEKCFFEVDEEVIHMKEGEVWEINNSEKAHSVQNQGDSDRIHLLIDWKVKSISN